MPTTFNINSAYNQMTRYLRRGKQGPTGAAIDLTVKPAFNALATPGAPTLTPSGTNGTLPAGTTYNYRISATNVNGETLPGPEAANATTTGTTSSIVVTWSAVTGATGYNVYGRIAGSEQLLASLGNVLTYTDTGASTPSGALNTVESTGAIVGAVLGQVNAGDMVYRTANGGVASLNNPGVANANAASFQGVSEDNYPTSLGLGAGITIGRPLNDNTPVRIAVRQSGEFKFKTTPGDVYNPGDLVYLGADAQTVQKTASGRSIGAVCNDQSSAYFDMSTPVTGAIGTEVAIEITPASPMA